MYSVDELQTGLAMSEALMLSATLDLQRFRQCETYSEALFNAKSIYRRMAAACTLSIRNNPASKPYCDELMTVTKQQCDKILTCFKEGLNYNEN